MFERSHDHRGEKESEPKEEVNDGRAAERLRVLTPTGRAPAGHGRPGPNTTDIWHKPISHWKELYADHNTPVNKKCAWLYTIQADTITEIKWH